MQKNNSDSLLHKTLSAQNIKILVVVAISVLVGYGIYSVGDSNGAKRQEKSDSKYINELKSNKNGLNKGATPLKSISLLGKVTQLSDKSLQVTDNKNKQTTLPIDLTTPVVDAKGAKSDTSKLSVGQTVVVSGIVKQDNTTLIQRVHIEK